MTDTENDSLLAVQIADALTTSLCGCGPEFHRLGFSAEGKPLTAPRMTRIPTAPADDAEASPR